jgi:hypothetical protein
MQEEKCFITLTLAFENGGYFSLKASHFLPETTLFVIAFSFGYYVAYKTKNYPPSIYSRVH